MGPNWRTKEFKCVISISEFEVLMFFFVHTHFGTSFSSIELTFIADSATIAWILFLHGMH